MTAPDIALQAKRLERLPASHGYDRHQEYVIVRSMRLCVSGPEFLHEKAYRYGRPAPGKVFPPRWMIAPALPVLELREEQAPYRWQPLHDGNLPGTL